MVAIGNGANIGGGTEVTPHADPESGSVDVMVSRAVSPLAKLSYTMKMAREGSHLEHPDVDYHRGQTVSVSGEAFYCSADGEIYGPERQRSWHVAAGGVPLRAAACRTAGRLEPAAARGLHAGLEPGVGPELDHQVGDPAAHGAQAEAEGAGDLLVLGARRELAQQAAADVDAGARGRGRAARWPGPSSARTAG